MTALQTFDDVVGLTSLPESDHEFVKTAMERYADQEVLKVLNYFREEYGIQTSAQKLYEQFKNETQ